MHGQIRSGKTIRFKAEQPRHDNATPYKRPQKYRYEHDEEQ